MVFGPLLILGVPFISTGPCTSVHVSLHCVPWCGQGVDGLWCLCVGPRRAGENNVWVYGYCQSMLFPSYLMVHRNE